jgi:hypothetical protein
MTHRIAMLCWGAAALLATSTASAGVNLNINLPLFGSDGYAPPVVYEPEPYYVPPPVVYGGGGRWGGGHDARPAPRRNAGRGHPEGAHGGGERKR